MKILIIGIVATGKTTLAKKLSIENNINYYEIDSVVHDDAKGTKRTNEEQQEIIKKINQNDNWIIEGTLRKNLDILLILADRIIYLDIPFKIRKRRILFRFIKQKLRIEKCNYKPNHEMLKNMYKWNKEFENNKKDFEEMIYKYKNKLIVLNTIKKVNEVKM